MLLLIIFGGRCMSVGFGGVFLWESGFECFVRLHH